MFFRRNYISLTPYTVRVDQSSPSADLTLNPYVKNSVKKAAENAESSAKPPAKVPESPVKKPTEIPETLVTKTIESPEISVKPAEISQSPAQKPPEAPQSAEDGLSQKPDWCAGKYIYVLDLPGEFNSNLLENCSTLNPWTNACKLLQNYGLGPKLSFRDESVFSGPNWFETDQWSLEVIFHYRMKQYKCLTNDYSKASAVYVPFYPGLDVGRYLWIENATLRDETSIKLANYVRNKPEWKRYRGRDHFLLAGRMAWDFSRGSDNFSDVSSWGNKLLHLPEIKNMTSLLLESRPMVKSEFAIPYPTYFHPSSGNEVHIWQEKMRQTKRPHLFSFAGAPRPNDRGSIRNVIIEQCLAAIGKNCKFVHTNSDVKPETVMSLLQSSDFCLQPPGDSLTRKSIFDTIIAGCIPVLFHPGSAYGQYIWHLPKDYSSYSVFIPMEELSQGKVSIEKRLLDIPKNKAIAMREEVIKLIPRIVYANSNSKVDNLVDAFEVAVSGVLDRVKRIKMEIEEEKNGSSERVPYHRGGKTGISEGEPPESSENEFGKKSDVCLGKYIYTLDLPGEFNSDLLKNCDTLKTVAEPCKLLENSGLGPPLSFSDDTVFSGSNWFGTDQWSIEVIFHNRMKQYKCLTNDYSKASAVFVPFYPGLDIGRYLWDSNVTLKDEASLKLVKYIRQKSEWKRFGGRDHFLLVGRMTWDFSRGSDNLSESNGWGNKLLHLPEIKNMTTLLLEANPQSKSEIAIPYPTYFHPSSGNEVHNWQENIRQKKRPYLFSFAGAPRPHMKESIRNVLIDQCIAAKGENCMFLHVKPDVTSEDIMRLFQMSDFCLQPPGDSYTRKSTFDTIVAGCIPVFFHPGSAYVHYVWHLPKDYSSYSVLIPMGELVAGKVSIEKILLEIPKEKIKAMREEVIKLIPRIVYANPNAQVDGYEDAFEITVKGVLDRVERLKTEMKGGKPSESIIPDQLAWKYKLYGNLDNHEFDKYFFA
ncbi:hypothetical protein vseg_015244 [Gypsophila vaccaria]